MDIKKAFSLLMQQEGIKETLIKGDKGGLTKFGIASASHPGVDIENLTEEGALNIYNSEYWNPAKCPELKTELQYAHFSCAVNCGVGSAARILQKASRLTPGGDIGEITLAAAKNTTLSDYCVLWKQHYDDIISDEKTKLIEEKGIDEYEKMLTTGETQEKFRKGWYNRIQHILDWDKQGMLN